MPQCGARGARRVEEKVVPLLEKIRAPSGRVSAKADGHPAEECQQRLTGVRRDDQLAKQTEYALVGLVALCEHGLSCL